MKILINGCSHLQGTGLDSHPEKTKKMTWPNLVWSNDTIENISISGSSNDKICRRTIEELEVTSYDLICIQWAIFERIEVKVPLHQKYGLIDARFCVHSRNAVFLDKFNGNGEFIHDLAKSIFLKQFDTEWFIDYNLSQIIVLQNWLNLHQIPYVFVMTETPTKVDWNSGRAKLIDQSKIIDISWFNFCKNHKFSKVDESHYEYQAHLSFSKFVKDEIEKKGIL